MAIVEVLADERVWLHCPVTVHLGHVEVVYEIDESFANRRSERTTSFLLQRFLQDT